MNWHCGFCQAPPRPQRGTSPRATFSHSAIDHRSTIRHVSSGRAGIEVDWRAHSRTNDELGAGSLRVEEEPAGAHQGQAVYVDVAAGRDGVDVDAGSPGCAGLVGVGVSEGDVYAGPCNLRERAVRPKLGTSPSATIPSPHPSWIPAFAGMTNGGPE